MKYNLRFFIASSGDDICFATIETKHRPEVNDKVYFGDEIISSKFKHLVKSGTVYQIYDTVYVFNCIESTLLTPTVSENKLTSVEVFVSPCE